MDAKPVSANRVVGAPSSEWNEAPHPSEHAKLAAFALVAAVAAFLMMRGQFAAVWHSGVFFDTDDTMHIVQVRALLAGQSWFDMTVPGMDPPGGTLMHWSRIADVALVLMMKLFSLAATEELALRVMRLLYPFVLLIGLYLAMARLAGSLLGRDARVPAIIGTLLSGSGVAEFMPGRVDHHAPQILILILMLGSAVAATQPSRARQAIAVGFLSGLSLSINLENLPFIVVIGGWLVAFWIRRGDEMRHALGAYAIGLAVGLPACFAMSVAPRLYAAPVCDAFGAAHLGAGLIAAAGCGGAFLAGARLHTTFARLAAMLGVGLVAFAFVALLYPRCLHSPFAAVDPLVREIWLSRVEESLPLTVLMRRDLPTALCSLVPILLGLGACGVAVRRLRGRRAAGFALVGLVVGTGLALAFWQVRVLSSITAVACCGGVYVALAARRHWLAEGRDRLASLSLAVLLPFTATAIGLVVPVEAAPAGVGRRGVTVADCLVPAAFRPLAGLQGTVIAPVDIGSYLLVHTQLAVYAAAFHRDNDGNRFALETMLATPTEARGGMRRRGVAYVLVCDGLPETNLLAARAPGSLAAALMAGEVPVWLEDMALARTPLRLYRVRPDPG